jgi:hypothetical protein
MLDALIAVVGTIIFMVLAFLLIRLLYRVSRGLLRLVWAAIRITFKVALFPIWIVFKVILGVGKVLIKIVDVIGDIVGGVGCALSDSGRTKMEHQRKIHPLVWQQEIFPGTFVHNHGGDIHKHPSKTGEQGHQHHRF